MNINLEDSELHSIQAYDAHQIQINSIVYVHSLIVSREEIISDVAIKSIKDMNEEYIKLLLKHKPEVIIIGHQETAHPPLDLISKLSQQRIGMECMSVGAACRTYNVLLGENRAVVAGFIL